MTNERGPNFSLAGTAAARLEPADVRDNAKRNVTMRIYTSDYGRVRLIAKRTGKRESDVLRLLIKIGLADLAPLYDTAARGRDLLRMWCAYGAHVTSHLQLDVRAVEELLDAAKEPGAAVLERDDVELLAMLDAPPRVLARRLSDLTGREHAPETIREEIAAYLGRKYFRSGDGGLR